MFRQRAQYDLLVPQQIIQSTAWCHTQQHSSEAVAIDHLILPVCGVGRKPGCGEFVPSIREREVCLGWRGSAGSIGRESGGERN